MVAGTSAGPVASSSSPRRASTMAVSSPVLFVAESAPSQRESATVVQTGPYSSTSGKGKQQPPTPPLPGTGPAPSIERTQHDSDSDIVRARVTAEGYARICSTSSRVCGFMGQRCGNFSLRHTNTFSQNGQVPTPTALPWSACCPALHVQCHNEPANLWTCLPGKGKPGTVTGYVRQGRCPVRWSRVAGPRPQAASC